MGIESRGYTPPEAEQKRSEKYQKEAEDIAKRISRSWKQLREKNPSFFDDDPELSDIEQLRSSPKSGIQRWYEGKVEFIENASGSEDAKSRMMYRLKEDLERIEKRIERIMSA